MPPFFERDLDYPPLVFSTVGKIMGTNVRSSLKGQSTKMISGSDSVANEVEKEETPPISSPPNSLRNPFEPPNCQQITQEFSKSNVSLIYTVGA